MFSLETIIHMNQQAAKKARRRGDKPFVPSGPENVENWPPFPFPIVGDFDPPGWERTEQSWFCDKTGLGQSWEPALTVEQLKKQLQCYVMENPGHGFAITEEGQFQLYVTAFRPTKDRHENVHDDL